MCAFQRLLLGSDLCIFSVLLYGAKLLAVLRLGILDGTARATPHKAPNKLGTSDCDCSPTQQGLSNTRETSILLNSRETQVSEGGGLLRQDGSGKADHLQNSQGNTRKQLATKACILSERSDEGLFFQACYAVVW